MLHKFCLALSFSVLSTLSFLPATSQAEEQNNELFVYNWYEYIAPNTVPDFEKKAGVKVTYDVYDSNEVLEAKLLSGRSGYDIVAPSHDFLANQIKAGVYEPLDKSRFKNYKNLNPEAMRLLDEVDPGNKYGIPYLWQTTGLAINPAKVKEFAGEDAPVDSWELVFNPKYMQKLEKCGVAFMDAPTEVFPAALRFIGKDPNSRRSGDYRAATDMLMKVAPYVTYFNSSRALTDLANGDVCVAIVWSGDALIADERAQKAGNGVSVKYVIPKEGAAVSYDVMAIPKDAENKENAYKFLDYVMEPKVAADITNFVYYANPNKAATPYVEKELRQNPGVYPSGAIEKSLYIFKPLDGKLRRVVTREWTRIISGQ
ncbi:polyamine ABC transporter substrate-binding protein [Sansalvadorimonas sp. 2012CJ34-2]|uniref:Putrescine-binding periplasmic protein n=1 Tax=Parendozoicomonas callyspongiae TaxID=2942213 RepID=A0ABT0PIK5_9GAMM|nr:polyamine ABC transporter substrate-binding protein [Sansalvadorimonas sp. 2012CJ34-2]MCL6271185.1 polyamine ABC transporter substrate-binding protein [Sansalvadorimonas sp. 2012CJ34-2]